jgi:hypothetical protein
VACGLTGILPAYTLFRMLLLTSRSRTNNLRLIGAGLLFFIFFLPLHSHPVAPPQLAKECACIHGNRTQIGLALDPVSCTPAFQETVIVLCEPKLSSWVFLDLRSIRAPPPVHSL